MTVGFKNEKEIIHNDPADDFTISMSSMQLGEEGEGNNRLLEGGGGMTKKEDEDFKVFSSSALPLGKDTSSKDGKVEHENTSSDKVQKEVDNDNKQGLVSKIDEENKNNSKKESSTEPPSIFSATSSPGSNRTKKLINDIKDNTLDPKTETTTTNQQRFVTPQDFDLLKVIGMGAFGKVLQVKNKISKQILAMKVISKRLLKHKTTYIENIHAEREILTKMKHPFIVTMHCSFQTKEKLFIIMDFLAGGELFLRLGRQGIFLEKTAAFYIAEIVLALEHLHSKGILHRDLKPENILLSTDGHLCLTDFGLSKDFQWDDGDMNEDGKALTVCGTQEYMAPEMVARKGYGKAADWWSLGCIAYEMLTGNPPFESKKGAKDLFRKIMNERVKMPDGATAAACVLLKGLLNRNATARFGAAKGTMFQVGGVAQVKQLPFFAHLNWGLLEQKKVEPPETLEIDNDEDVRHFYDEFTTMGLPRSVIEMSDEHFKPRRCQSDAFRGFSFIQDDFVLPDRSDEKADNYWNNIDEDGESLSDCASSVGGMDDDTKASNQLQRGGNMTTVLDSTPEKPVKKKRPPRKKKKKLPTIEDNAETKKEKSDNLKTGQTAVANSLSSSSTTELAKSQQDSRPSEPIKKIETEAMSKVKVQTPWSSSTTQTNKLSTDQPNVTKTAEVKANSATWETTKKIKKVPAPAWETVKTKDTLSTTRNRAVIDSNNIKTTGMTRQPISSLQSPTSNYAPYNNKSSSQWASRGLPPAITPQSYESKNGRALGVSGVSNWTDHTLIRNISGSNSSRSLGPPTTSGSNDFPSLNMSSDPQKKDKWPSLGVPSKKNNKTSNPTPVISKNAQSPWVTKGSTAGSGNAWGKGGK